MFEIKLVLFDKKVTIKRDFSKNITNEDILCYRYYSNKKELYCICKIDNFSNNQNSFIENKDGFIYKINNIFYSIRNEGKEMEKITTFLEEHMIKVFNDFKNEEWCELQNNGLDTNHYSNISKQQYYLLKYFPAYFTEYYHAYSKLFKDLNKDVISIISIGCGAGLDYYALEHYKRVNNSNLNYNY